MKVVILCGGRGTRLGAETAERPKPMLPVGDRPLLWHIMRGFAAQGFTEFVLALGYRGEQIKDFFLRADALAADLTVEVGRGVVSRGPLPEEGWRVTLADTGPDALTGARVKRVQRHVGGERFMLTYGDGLADVDLRGLLSAHEAGVRLGRLGTVTAVSPPGRFGELTTSGDRVADFSEKPPGGCVNGGFFVFEPRFFDYLDAADGCVLERDPLERLTRDGGLGAYRHPGFWQPVDTAADYALVQGLWASGRAPWKTWT